MREKMEMKTHTLAVAVTAGWPMALTLLLMCAMVLAIFPKEQAWLVGGLLTGFVALTYLWCMKMYLGAYVFLPPTEYKGARIIARLGRNQDVEISGVLADEIIVRQGPLEKLFGVCHIREKGTAVYLRGVREPEKVKAWIDANFPRERKMAPARGKKRRK